MATKTFDKFTAAEWDALFDAIVLQDTVWEQDGDENGIDSRSAQRKREALQRAQAKARQLAPRSRQL